MSDAAMKHAAAFRRCLLALDVDGIMRLTRELDPAIPEQSVADATISMHIARCEMRGLPKRANRYSEEFLAERGYHKVAGKWVSGPVKNVVVTAVGIASNAAPGVVTPFNVAVRRRMEDALLNAMAKGVHEPEMQKEAILAARARARFKARIA